MITLTINNVHCHIAGLRGPALYKISNELSYRVQGYQFMAAYKNGWDGKIRLLKKDQNGHTFLSGLLKKVESMLRGQGLTYTIIDKRTPVEFKRKIKTKNIESRPYQDRVHQACLNNYCGIVKSATGSGKSIMIARLIADTNIKTMVMVTGVDLLYQLHHLLEEKLGVKIGIIGDGKANVKKINVCSVWTAATALGKKYEALDDEDRTKSKKEMVSSKNKSKITKAIKEAELVVFDECHMIATRTIQDINTACQSAYYKFGYSGTPWRDDGADILIESVCGDTIVEVTASELIKDGFLVQPTIHFINVPEIGKSSNNYHSIYKEYIVDNEVRNNKIINSARKLVESGRKVLILVKTLRHGDLLLKELGSEFVTHFVRGEVNSVERNRVRREFTKGKIDIIIASVIFDQGIDLPALDALILAGSGKSSGRALQRLGRVIRPHKGKKDAIVIDFIDNIKYLLNHTAERIKIYRYEAGFKIKLPKRNQSKSSKTKRKSKTIRKNKKAW